MSSPVTALWGLKKLRSCTSLAVLALISASWPSLEKRIFTVSSLFFFLFSQGVVFHDADDSKGTQAEAFTSGVFKERPLRFPRTSRVHRSCDKKSLLICMHSYKFTQLLNNDNSSKIRCNSGLSPFFSFGSSLFDDRGHRFLNRWKVTPTNVTFASSASKPKCGGCCPTLWRRLFWWLEVCKLARCEGCSRGRF